MSEIRINPSTDPIELAASLEVVKTLAFHILTLAILAVGTPIPAVPAGLASTKGMLLARIKNAKIGLSDEEETKYRAYAEATIEELFGRLAIDGNPINPLSS